MREVINVEQVPQVYRVRPEWRDGRWLVRSPDVPSLYFSKSRLDHIEVAAARAIARTTGQPRSAVSVVVQLGSVFDPALRHLTSTARQAQEANRASARYARDTTFVAVEALARAGMSQRDVNEVLRVTDEWELDERVERYGDEARFNVGPWMNSVSSFWGGRLDPWRGTSWSSAGQMLVALEAEVGGPAELATLTAEPLPDEPFSCGGFPMDALIPISDVESACDDACDELFDVETRTACRRTLSRFVRRRPQYFLRPNVQAHRFAASICWVVAKANRLFSVKESPRIGELTEFFGVAHAASNAEVIITACGFERPAHNYLILGSADLLVAAHRRRIIALRDLCGFEPRESVQHPVLHLVDADYEAEASRD